MSMQAATLQVAANAIPVPATRDDWVDDEAYRELFVSVIELAIKDFEFLQRIRRQQTLTPSERKKLRGLTEDGGRRVFSQQLTGIAEIKGSIGRVDWRGRIEKGAGWR